MGGRCLVLMKMRVGVGLWVESVVESEGSAQFQ